LILLSSDFNSKNKKTLKRNKQKITVVININPKKLGLVDLGEWRIFEDKAGGDTMIVSSLDTSSGKD
jgi:hypothetical protein